MHEGKHVWRWHGCLFPPQDVSFPRRLYFGVSPLRFGAEGIDAQEVVIDGAVPLYIA